jgi:hypothetical protein
MHFIIYLFYHHILLKLLDFLLFRCVHSYWIKCQKKFNDENNNKRQYYLS